MKQKLLLIFFLFGAVLTSMAQTGIITGKVTDAKTGEALIGVNVALKGTTTGSITDINGAYSVKAPGTGSLVFSFIGYESQTIALNNRSIIDVSFVADSRELDQVVVIGYGEVKKSNVTGSIVSIKPEELKKVPTANVMEALQGKIPGVDITRNSGSAGSGVSVTIRGNRSLSANNDPLYIVDGIQYSSIQDLHSSDIQSMEVLKDAASTAIYGSRGANGVILITTKKGKEGKTQVSFNTYMGTSEVTGYPKVMNADQFKAFRKEAFRAAGTTDNAVLGTADTNWQDLFLKKGSQKDYQLGISSGTEKTNVYLSLNYFNEQGVFKKDEFNRYAIRANINHTISKIFKVGTQNQFTYYNQYFRTPPLNTANQLSPLEAPYDANGNIVQSLTNGRTINPLMDDEPNNYQNNRRTARTFLSVYGEIHPMEGLMFRTNLGVNITNIRNGLYANALTVTRNGQASLASYGNNSSVNYNLENILSYSKKIQDHSFTITAIHSMLKNRMDSVMAQGQNQLLSVQQFYALANANQNIAISSGLIESSLLSYTGRIQYGYKDRYLFMATGRADGASQLSVGKKWAFFPSASFAWRIIEENFMKNNRNFSDLKLRLSYGVAGSSSIAPYATQSVLNRVAFGYDETPAIGYTFGNIIGNKNLGWETSATANFGLDYGLLNNRITGTIDVFQTKTKNLILQRLLPLTSGFQSTFENVGKTQTTGIELGISGVVIDKKDWKWTLGGSWFTTKEKIVELATSSNDVANGWFIGQPTQAFYDYQKLGIWQTSEAEQAKLFKQVPGDIKVKDQNGDGVIDSNNDRVVLGSTRPKWVASLNSDVKYKAFDFGLQFFARWGQMMNYGIVANYDPQANTNSLVHDYWTPENPTNDFPRPNANRSQSATQYFSTLFFKDASFVKLRAMTLGYTVPSVLTNKWGISSLRVYVTGRNLWTYSKVDNYDPERGGGLENPMTKLWVGGLNLTF